MDGIDPTQLPTVHSLGKMVTKGADEETALKSFEAYIVGEMLRRATPKDPSGLFDGGQAGRMYQDHLYQEFARIIAEQGDLGLAKQMEGSLGPRGSSEATANSESEVEAGAPALLLRKEGE